MKKISLLAILTVLMSLTACNDYIDILPKGNKIPKDVSDFVPLLNDEYNNCFHGAGAALYLMNDNYLTKSNRQSLTLNSANYLWNEEADRVLLNKDSENFFYYLYMSISTDNLIINNVPEMTGDDAAKKQLIAEARTLRAYNYLMLVNFYSDSYLKGDPAQAGGVPFIMDASVDAPYTQPCVKEIYDFIISELQAVIASNELPAEAVNVLRPSKATAQAILARALMLSGRYDEALTAVNSALETYSTLFNWVEFYQANEANILAEGGYTQAPSPMGYDFCENVLYRSGDRACNYEQADLQMPLHRAALYEAGDAMLASRWKERTQNQDTYMYPMTKGYYNYGGITVTELYCIKAECEARAGRIPEAMKVLNAVRQTRIMPDEYIEMSATDLADALQKIYRVKANSLVMNVICFFDAKRLNAEGIAPVVLTKTEDGKEYRLDPNSHLWTMTFPATAVKNHGNGSFTQNSK